MKDDFIIFYYYSEEFLINLHYIRKQWKSTNLSLLLTSHITLMIPTNITFCFHPLPRRTFLFILCSACPFAHILNFLLYRLRTLVQQIAADSGRRRKELFSCMKSRSALFQLECVPLHTFTFTRTLLEADVQEHVFMQLLFLNSFVRMTQERDSKMSNGNDCCRMFPSDHQSQQGWDRDRVRVSKRTDMGLDLRETRTWHICVPN